MKNKDDRAKEIAELRRRAEEMAREKAAQSPENLEALSPEATRRTLHELHVHQIELEMQNEELCRAQAELEAARARYFDLYNLAPVGYCTIAEQGLILEANLTAATLFGVARRDLVKQPLTRFILPEDQDSYYRFRQQLFATGASQACEFRMLRAEAAPFWARLEATVAQDADGAPGCRVVISDITARKQAEEVLRESEERHRAETALRDTEERMNLAASSAELGMWWWDIARDQIEVTEKCRALYGFAPAAPLNYQAFLNTLHPDDREPTHQAIQQVLAEQTEFHGEYRVVWPDGSLHWLTAKGRGYFDSAGKPLRMLGASIDITERKQVELEVLRQRQELAHMMRVVTLGELSTALAHELNQPLTAILSNAQAAQRLLAHGRLEGEELTAILADIVTAAQRASEVIYQVRAMLKKGEVQRQPLDINAIIREVSKLIHSDLITRQVSLAMTLDTTLPGVTGDPIQLQQVVLNLLLNGAEAMLASASRPRQLEVRTTRPDAATIEVSVHDTGVGIDPQQVEHIFEPFVTTKPHGLGMGLAISRSIIAAHGGRLWAENNADGGATFHFTLPVNPEAAAC